MIDAVTAPDTLENNVLLILAVEWDQDGHRFADNLFRQIAKEPLRALIPTRDDAIEVLAYYCVITELDNRSEPPKLLPTFAQRLFHLITLNEVRGLSGKHVQWL